MTTIAQTTERKGSRIRLRYIVAMVALVPVIAHLFFAISRSPLTNYYITVDELARQSASVDQARRIRVGGPVTNGSINWNNTTRSLTFQIQGEGRALAVNYRGFAPDTFRDGATVIVEGELARDGTFTAYNLLVKCPHSYVSAG